MMHDAGKDVPAVRNKPSIVGLRWLWEAFWDLSTCRHIGMVAGPIPWSSIESYADSNDMDGGEKEILHHVVRHMDTIWLDAMSKKVKRKPNPKSKTKGAIGR